MKKDKNRISPILKLAACIIVVLGIMIVYVSNNSMVSVERANESAMTLLMSGIISLFCGYLCSKWAAKIKKSVNAAFIIGFLFGLAGLLGYFIYYKIKIKKGKRKKINK